MADRPYAMPGSNDTAGLYEFFSFTNSAADGLFMPAMLFVLWIVIFLASKGFSSSRAFTIASGICAMLSIPLAIMELISPKFMYLVIVLTAAGALWLKLEGGSNF